MSKTKARATIESKEVDINSILDGSINYETWKKVRANTLGFRALYSKLDNNALDKVVQHNLYNCSCHSDTYESTLQNILVPLLLARLRVVEKALSYLVCVSISHNEVIEIVETTLEILQNKRIDIHADVKEMPLI